MAQVVTHLGRSGRLVIPAAFRHELGLREGDELLVGLDDGELTIRTLEKAVEQAQMAVAAHVAPERNLVDELLAERRAEVDDG